MSKLNTVKWRSMWAHNRGWTWATPNNLKKLLENSDLREATADATFALTTETGLPEIIPVHRILLAITSDVLMKMFYGPMAETTMPIVITDITAETFKTMLECIYTNSRQTISQSNAMALLYVAHKYGIDNLFTHCQSVAASSLSPANVFHYLAHGQVFDATKLVTACYEFIDKHTTKVLNSEAFLDQAATAVRAILERDTLAGDAMPEKCFYKALTKWSGAGNDRLGATSELVSLIRFPVMTTEDVVEAVKSGILQKDEATQVLGQLCGLPDVFTRFVARERTGRQAALDEIKRNSEVTAMVDCPSCNGSGTPSKKPPAVGGKKRTCATTDCTKCKGVGRLSETTKVVLQPEIKCDFCGGFHGLG